MIKTIEFKEEVYPKFQAEGFASKFAFPFAQQVCKGLGVDVGCSKIEWSYNDSKRHYCLKEKSYLKWILEKQRDVLHKLETFQDYVVYQKWYKFDYLSFPIDPSINEFNATNFPEGCENLDYVFSSHCLEHISNYVEALEYWKSKLKDKGVLFLYLPSSTQRYWLPQHNRKHLHAFTPNIIKECLEDLGFNNIFVSGIDLNNSFCAMCNK